MSKPTGSLYTLLSDAQLQRLRDGFSEEDMLPLAQAGVCGLAQAMQGWTDWLGETLYAPERMNPRDRELCLLCHFMTNGSEKPFMIHLYWGLMAGLSVEEVVQSLMLMANYCGMSTFYTVAGWINRTLRVLATQAERGTTQPEMLLLALSGQATARAAA